MSTPPDGRLDELRAATAKERRRAGYRAILMVVVSLLLTAGGVIGVYDGGKPWAWLVVAMFLLAAATYLRQALIDLGYVSPRPTAAQIAGTVTFDNAEIVYTRRRRPPDRIAWADLDRVLIHAEDAMPVGNVYWILATGAGHVAIPIDADGTQAMLEAMQARLPGFDNEAVVTAMSMLDGTVEAWKRDGTDGS